MRSMGYRKSRLEFHFPLGTAGCSWQLALPGSACSSSLCTCNENSSPRLRKPFLSLRGACWGCEEPWQSRPAARRRMSCWLPAGTKEAAISRSCGLCLPSHAQLPNTTVLLMSSQNCSLGSPIFRQFHPELGLLCVIVEFISAAAPDAFITFMCLSIESGDEFMGLII